MMLNAKPDAVLMSNLLQAIDCAFSGEDHPLVQRISLSERELREVVRRTAFYPLARKVSTPVIKQNEISMGYGEGRYMGD